MDDFELRKGDSYVTILINLEARRPPDVLPDRRAAPLADWLRGHPETKVIYRNRAGAHTKDARTGAPQPKQIAQTGGICGGTSPRLWRRRSAPATAASWPRW
nr:hypothetical protein [Streptomyces lacrimifluminis]